MPITDTNLGALLRLLDEPDAPQLAALIDHLAGLPAPELEALRERARTGSANARRNIEYAHQRAVFARLEPEWRELASRRRPSLEAGLVLISRTKQDDAEAHIAARLDSLAAQVGARLSGDRAFDNGLAILGEVLRHTGLRGNPVDYYSPDNSYLHAVLATGLGIPISLCSVAILVGQRLELPVHGIGVPGHFLGYYGDADLGLGACFDPLGGFAKMTSGEVSELIRRYVPGGMDVGQLRPATEREILARTLRNLMSCHTRLGSVEIAQNFRVWLEIIEGHFGNQ